MKTYLRKNSLKAWAILAATGLGFMAQPLLEADVLILQSGAVITGNVLQQDANGVLLQMEYGTFRYPPVMIREVKKEAAVAPHVSNNGQVIPDWAQIVSLLANNGWAESLKQVPATVINYGKFNSVPYVSFRCADGGYEINIFGDLNNPAAVQIGAMDYLKQSDPAKSNCVNFICSVLASAADRKMVRALNWNQSDKLASGGMTCQTLMPGEWGSYGGWMLTVYSETALASARASAAELATLTQSRAAAAQSALATVQPAATVADVAPAMTPGLTAQPVMTNATATNYNNYYGYGTTYAAATVWTQEELANARPANPPPATDPAAVDDATHPVSTTDAVYPRTYARTAGSYGRAELRR